MPGRARPGPGPHHDPSERWVDEPWPDLDDTVTLTVDLGGVPLTGPAWLRTVEDGQEQWYEGTPDGDRVRFPLICHQPVTSYRFHLDTAQGPRWLTGLGLLDWDPPDHGDFRLVTGHGGVAWVPERVWYQIFPDRFHTTGRHREKAAAWADPAAWTDPVATGPAAMTQLYGGDLDGITARLDHLVDLGVGGIYLTPFFPARSNHRYDGSSFDHVDPVLGGDEALARLTAAAARRGLRVIGDLTLNHTGVGHEWFRAARADPAAPEAGFYHFTDHPDGYVSWLDVPSLPKLDHRDAELRRRLYHGRDSVVARYLDPPFNLAGWRIDVANMTGRLGPVDLNHEVARLTRATVEAAGGDRWLVAEHHFDASADCRGDTWHGVMNYLGGAKPIGSWLGAPEHLRRMIPGPGIARRDGNAMATALDAARAALGWAVVMTSLDLVSSHDSARWRTITGSDEAAVAGFGLLVTLPGVPMLLYGDEVGLTGADNEQARRPMPWDAGLWNERIHDDHRRLIGLRNRSPALRRGGFRWVHVGADEVVFLRESVDERVLVRAARASVERPLALSTVALGATGAEALHDADDLTATGTGPGDVPTLVLPAHGPSISLWRLHGSRSGPPR